MCNICKLKGRRCERKSDLRTLTGLISTLHCILLNSCVYLCFFSCSSCGVVCLFSFCVSISPSSFRRWSEAGWRGQWYKRSLTAIVYLQCCIRRMRAKRELKKLKIEARSVEHFKKLNIGMENKIMQLQRRVDEQVPHFTLTCCGLLCLIKKFSQYEFIMSFLVFLCTYMHVFL